MLVACLMVPSLALVCVLSDRPDLADSPVALTDRERVRVLQCTPEAARYGVHAGLPLRTAIALCPSLAVLEERPARMAQAAEALVEALASISPLIGEAEAGTVYADLRGLEGLYPRAGALEAAILAAAPPALHPSLGIADTRFTAHVAARSVPRGGAQRIEDDQAAAFLATRPAAWLPLD